MKRLDINELIDHNSSFVRDGTAAMYLATNPYNNKTGILKENGCMLGIEDEDLREKLASIILNLCGVEAAEIELCIDENQKRYCFSYNVLKENQVHVELSSNNTVAIDKEEIFKEYIQKLSTAIICLPQMSKQEYDAIRKRIIEIHFMDLIIDHYDRKTDNSKIIYDNSIKKYLPPIAYDYGVAFNPNACQKNGIFYYLTNEEVLKFLIKYHFHELSDLIKRIKQNLTEENLNLILSKEEFKDLDTTLIFNQIQNRLIQLDNLLLGQNISQLNNLERRKTL